MGGGGVVGQGWVQGQGIGAKEAELARLLGRQRRRRRAGGPCSARRLPRLLLIPSITADSCLVIEDSIPGIRSAKTAGMKVLAVANTHTIQDLHEAHAVVHSLSQIRLSELRERLWPAA